MNKKVIISSFLVIFCFLIVSRNCFAPIIGKNGVQTEHNQLPIDSSRGAGYNPKAAQLTSENLRQLDDGIGTKRLSDSFSSVGSSVGYYSDLPLSSRGSSASTVSKYDPHASVGYRGTPSPTKSVAKTSSSQWNSSASVKSSSPKAIPRPRYDVTFVKPIEGLGEKLDPKTVNRAIDYEKSLEDYRVRESARRFIESDQVEVVDQTKPQLPATPSDSDRTYMQTQRRNPSSVQLYDDVYTPFKPKVEPPTEDEMKRAIIDGLTSGKIKIEDLSGEDLALATELLQTNLLNKQRERTRDIGLGAFGKPSRYFGD